MFNNIKRWVKKAEELDKRNIGKAHRILHITKLFINPFTLYELTLVIKYNNVVPPRIASDETAEDICKDLDKLEKYLVTVHFKKKMKRLVG